MNPRDTVSKVSGEPSACHACPVTGRSGLVLVPRSLQEPTVSVWSLKVQELEALCLLPSSSQILWKGVFSSTCYFAIVYNVLESRTFFFLVYRSLNQEAPPSRPKTIHLFIYYFIQYIFIECLPFTRSSPESWK